MTSSERRNLGIYLFSRKGVPLLALPAGETLPVDPSQVEGVLALAGEFDDAPATPGNGVARVRYDEYAILGIRGERAVAAMVSDHPSSQDLVPELERFLRRCDKRLRRRTHDG